MKRVTGFFLGSFLFSVCLFAQETALIPTADLKPKQYFPSIPLPAKEAPAPGEVLASVLKTTAYPNLGTADFRLYSLIKSPYGNHYLFHLTFGGIVAERQYIRVFVDNAFVVRQVITLLDGADNVPVGNFGDEAVLRSQLTGMKKVGTISKVWYYDNQGWLPLLKAEVIEGTGAYAEFRFYDASYRHVLSKDNALRFHNQDSSIRAKVFWPDPLTSARVSYGGAYEDFQDADSPALNNQRYTKQIQAWFENDSFYLKDSTFYFAAIESPVSTIPVMTDTMWDFTRNHPHFEYVNSFYHMQTWVRRVHDLGFDLPGMQIQVDPHAANGADVSGFTPAFGVPALLFGEGGIDDAEDADVLIHELGHALSYGAAPNTTTGLQRTSMEEGTSDYFAMSYSREISYFGWRKTFNWDGNETWQGRIVTTGKNYPQDYSINKYSNAEIWVAGLTEIYGYLGPDVTDRMVLCALYNQVGDMTFDQMVRNCLQCDSIQNGGANAGDIYWAMARRGLMETNSVKSVTAPEWTLRNSAGFALGEGPLWIDFANEPFSGRIAIYDMQGKCIREEEVYDVTEWYLKAQDMKKGLYVLRVLSHTNLSAGFLIESY